MQPRKLSTSPHKTYQKENRTFEWVPALLREKSSKHASLRYFSTPFLLCGAIFFSRDYTIWILHSALEAVAAFHAAKKSLQAAIVMNIADILKQRGVKRLLSFVNRYLYSASEYLTKNV